MGTSHETARAPASHEAFLSLREVVVLADVSERKVRKDIETGILPVPPASRQAGGRLRFAWQHVYVIAAAYGNASANGTLRKAIIAGVAGALHDRADATSDETLAGLGAPIDVSLDRYIKVDLEKVGRDTVPRVRLYAEGLTRIERRPDVLGGDAVFTGTRLPVTHIGRMVADGASTEDMLEDYSSLTADDLSFAELYYRAHPSTGRPRRKMIDAAAPS